MTWQPTDLPAFMRHVAEQQIGTAPESRFQLLADDADDEAFPVSGQPA